MTEPCGQCEPWPLDATCCPRLAENPRPPEVQRAAAIAVEWLWRATAGMVGVCVETVRPCRATCPEYTAFGWQPWVQPVLDGGRWINLSCGCSSQCSCTPVCAVSLPGPVLDIVRVMQDGRVLPPSAYRLIEPDKLLRTEGGCWPYCQDMNAPDTMPRTWSVTYRRGREYTAMAAQAAGALACQLLKACASDASCVLPTNVQSLTRDGISYQFLEEQAAGGMFRTNVRAADDFIALINPGAMRSKPAVWTPDLLRPYVDQYPVGPPCPAPPPPPPYAAAQLYEGPYA